MIFLDQARLNKFQKTITIAIDLNTEVCPNGTLGSQFECLLKRVDDGIKDIIKFSEKKAIINVDQENTVTVNKEARIMLTLMKTHLK